MKQNKKLKVLLICGFSNQQIREKLPLSKHNFVNFFKLLFNMPARKPYSDFGTWVTILLNELGKMENVELHVVSGHIGMKKMSGTFIQKNIKYHFYKQDIPLIHLPLPLKSYWGLNPQVIFSRYFVRKKIKNFNPDIINLMGSEYPPKALSVLGYKNIPVYVLLQAVLFTPFKEKYKYITEEYRLKVERKIFENCVYFGTASRMYNDCVLKVNPTAKIFEFWFPTQRPPEILSQEILYDFVFFAKSVNNIKGIEDTIEALSLVKKKRSSVKLNIVGSCDPDYKVFLLKRIVDLGLQDNIEFHDYFPEHKDMFVQVKKSKIAVLPNKLDVVSSTIREAMFLEIPIATTITSGTPYLNAKNQTVLLSEISNIEELANNMHRLLIDSELCNDLVKNAVALAEEVFDNTAIAKKLVKDNIAIVDHFNENKSIPKELLFNPNNYPEYLNL